MQNEKNRKAVLTIKAGWSPNSDDLLVKLIKHEPLNDGSGLNKVCIGSVKWHDLAEGRDLDFPIDGATFRLDRETVRSLLSVDEVRLALGIEKD